MPANGLTVASGEVRSGPHDRVILEPGCNGTMILKDSLRVGSDLLPAGNYRPHLGCGWVTVRIPEGHVRRVSVQFDVIATLATLRVGAAGPGTTSLDLVLR
jgi:hypothetical protein